MYLCLYTRHTYFTNLHVSVYLQYILYSHAVIKSGNLQSALHSASARSVEATVTCTKQLSIYNLHKVFITCKKQFLDACSIPIGLQHQFLFFQDHAFLLDPCLLIFQCMQITMSWISSVWRNFIFGRKVKDYFFTKVTRLLVSNSRSLVTNSSVKFLCSFLARFFLHSTSVSN